MMPTDDRIEELEAQLDRAVAALKDARDAIKTLPIDALGTGQEVLGHDGQYDVLTWPIRDELLDKMAKAISIVKDEVE
jgi:hypothetical protein